MFEFKDLRGKMREIRPATIQEIRTSPDTIIVLSNGNCIPSSETAATLVNRLLLTPRQLEYRYSPVGRLA